MKSISDILHNNYAKYQSVKTRLIHGDLHVGNIIVSERNKLTLIDMDNLSTGFIPFELAKPLVSRFDQFDEFLLGYKSEHKLTKNEIRHIPLFTLLRLFKKIKQIN